MKRIRLTGLVLAMAMVALPTSASPNFRGETRLFSFSPNFDAVLSNPIGRWADELFLLLSVRAEHLMWEDGSLTELFFLIDDLESCSIGILKLEEEVYACGSLVEDTPVPLSSEQIKALGEWPDSLFDGEIGGESPQALNADEFAATIGELAKTCLSLRDENEEYGALDATAHVLSTLSESIVEPHPAPILVISAREIENLYGFFEEEQADSPSEKMPEEVLSRFLWTIAESIMNPGGKPFD